MKLEATTVAEISRTMKMVLQEYLEVEVVDINVITKVKTQITMKTLSNPVITSTRRNHNTIVKVKTLHIVVVVNSVVEVIVVVVVVVDTVTGKKQDLYKKLSLVVTRKSLMLVKNK